MLVLSRKAGERVVIADNIEVTVLELHGHKVRLGFAAPRDVSIHREEVYERIEKLTGVLTAHPHIAGFTYTQLTDVQQEVNGVYTFDREEKFDPERLREIFGAPAAVEQ